MPDPLVLDQALPDPLYAKLLQLVDDAPWQYGSKSNSKTDPHGHFAWKPVHDERLNLADLAAFLPPLLGEAWREAEARIAMSRPSLPKHNKLIRCYVNGYPYGCDGYFHRDSNRAGEFTAILYLTSTWPIDWGGETAVSDRLYWAVLPARNRLLVIPSDTLHCARAVSRKCPAMRTVLVFKFRPQRSALFEELSAWLVEHGALRLNHGKDSSLHDHLLRCFQLLEERGADRDTCLGAGLHSIYGTNAFTTQLIKPEVHNRALLAGRWGLRAEDLAYKFSLLDRPKTLDWIAEFIPSVDVAGDYAKLELRCKDSLTVDHATARALCAMEGANLADQGALDRWKHLTTLWNHCNGTKSASTPSKCG